MPQGSDSSMTQRRITGGNDYFVQAGEINHPLQTGWRKKGLSRNTTKKGEKKLNQMRTTDQGGRHVSKRSHRDGSYLNESDDCQQNSKTIFLKQLFKRAN